MRSDEINKNEISTEEVFTEQELSKLNETLKNNENIELPESLSKENVKDLLKKEVNKLEVLEKETENLKKENKALNYDLLLENSCQACYQCDCSYNEQYINCINDSICCLQPESIFIKTCTSHDR